MRVDKLRQVMAERELEAMLISRAENMRYISEYTGGDGHTLVTERGQWIITDSRYYEQVARQAPEFELVKMNEGFAKLLPQLVADIGLRRVGFESAFVTHDQHSEWSKAAEGVEWVPTKHLVLALRSLKDESELAAIREAVAIGDAAIERLMGTIQPGMTEKEVAWALEVDLRSHGAEAVSFPIIVGSGPNGAMPHAVVSDKVIQAGEPIVIDMGCVVDGYCSDMTRTFSVGAPDDLDEYLKVWNIVLEAQTQGRDAIRAGVIGRDANAVAKQVIGEAGYGAHFGHGLGHGVGLAIHELPRVGALSEDVLKPGAVVTVEPGVYLEGRWGVRIEDMGVVTQEGIEILTSARKVAVVD